MKIILLIVSVLMLWLFIKEKIKNYVLAMWMAEKNYPTPERNDIERLAKKVTDRIFKRN